MTMKLGYRDGGLTSEEGVHRISSRLISAAGVMADNDFKVTAAGTPDNTVKVAVGDIVIGENSPSTTEADFFYHGWNDAEASFVISANASGNPRIDVLVVYVDLSVVDDSLPDNPGALVVKVVTGTAAATPAAPNDAAIQADIGSGNPWMLVARVAVSNGFSTITNSDIIDLRIKSSTTARLADKGFQDFIGEGLVWSQKTGLIGKMTTGYGYINGELTGKSYFEHTFTASKDTYVDLPLTSKPTSVDDLTFTAVTNGAAAPALAANSMRLAKVVTDGSAITATTTSGYDSLGNPIYPPAIGSISESNLSQALQDYLTGGWRPLASTLTYSGINSAREYLLNSSADLRSVLSPGMRLKVSRGTTPPTQCTDIESSSTQWWSKATPSGIIFTDDFTCEGWIKVESYTTGVIGGRRAAGGGFQLRITTIGTINLLGLNGANFRQCETLTTVQLGTWVHVAATLDMSGNTGTIYINGELVTTVMSTTGSPSSLVQSGDLGVGAYTTGLEGFDGKVCEFRVWDTIRNATQVKDNMNKVLVGNESNLVAYFPFNGNGNDSTANANNLTAQNSVNATSADNPMNATEYAKVVAITASTLTVKTGLTGHIPNMTLSNPYYSTQLIPQGLPANLVGDNVLGYKQLGSSFSTTATSVTAILGLSVTATVPDGGCRIGAKLVAGGLYNTGGTNNTSASIWEGTVGSGRRLAYGYGLASGGASSMVNAEAVYHATAGQKTWNAGMVVSAGTGTFEADPSGNAYLIIEAR